MANINKNLFGGMAGKLTDIRGVVIHNDAGSMTAVQYIDWLKGHNPEAGFAHYYIDRFNVARVENTYNRAWHCGDSWNENSGGNAHYIGYEVVQSLYASDEDFLANEQAVFKQAAEDLEFYGLPANRNTVRLHKEFSSTTCPHRSWDLHGRSINSVKDYFISQIKLYMKGGSGKPSAPTPKPPVNKPSKPSKAKASYYTTKPGSVKLKTTCSLYGAKDIGFTGAPIGGTYKPGTVFKIKGVTKSKGGTPRLIAESGHLLTANKAYVEAISNKAPSKPASEWSGKSGSYTLKRATNLRTSASTGGGLIALLPAGSVVQFKGMKNAGGYTWIRQPRGNGYGYLAIGTSDGKTSWGTIKYK